MKRKAGMVALALVVLLQPVAAGAIEMNQVATTKDKDVGNELDLIVGFRNLFGVRGLGTDVKAGLFFPGNAFDNPGTTRRANKGLIITTTIIF